MSAEPRPEPTPSQTVGPFFHDALLDPDRSRLVPPDHPGAIRLYGVVYDGAGEPVPDAMVEVWQANPAGRYDLPLQEGFSGFGRSGTDAGGGYSFTTLKPGRVTGPGGGGMQAPHATLSVFARGLLKRAVTRLYFPDEAEANAQDPVLGSIADPGVRRTMIATATDDGYRLDIRLQGDGQTAFLDV